MTTDEKRLSQTLTQVPDSPGVYMMVDRNDDILYIGKAVSLRNRVRSYFQDSAAHHIRTQAMVERVVDVRTIVVSNEVEALILEANLIKRYQPPYNVRLRDDKRYPYLKVTNEPFPRVVFTRVVKDDGARYFGPYTNASALRELIDLVRLVFPLRTCPEPAATFSACFGAPFLPLRPAVYASFLGRRLAQHGSRVWLVNTGWTGGPAGEGERMPLRYTRAMVTAALEGQLDRVPTSPDPIFGVEVPRGCPGVPESLLDPRSTWREPTSYDAQARRLASMFAENFAAFAPDVAPEVASAGPRA